MQRHPKGNPNLLNIVLDRIQNCLSHHFYFRFVFQALDSDEGDNAAIVYALLLDDENNFLTNHLSMNSQSGEVDIVEPFDREQIETITFKVSYF